MIGAVVDDDRMVTAQVWNVLWFRVISVLSLLRVETVDFESGSFRNLIIEAA